MPNAQPKSIYKFKPYIMGPRTGRVHLDDGIAADDQPYAPPQLVPGMMGVTMDQLQQGPPPPPPVDAPESDESLLNPGYSQSIDRMKALYGERPERTPSHWWQKALSGAIGGLAGYANAAGRVRHPIDVSQAVENIQHPGYAGKLQDWQSRVAGLQGQTDLEGARQNAELKAQQIGAQAESRLSNAQARQQMADPHRSQQQLDPDFVRENFPWMHPDAKGEYWVDKTVANTIQKPVKETMDRGVPVADPEAAKFLGIDPSAPIDRDLYKVWLTHKAAMELVDKKPTNVKQDKVWLAQQAAAGDPQAQKALDILAKNTLASKPPKSAGAGAVGAGPGGISADAIDLMARNILSGGAMPALGYGKDAAATRAKVLNRAAEMNPNADLSSARAENHALSQAMASQEKMAGQIGSFEDTANRNMDVALRLSSKMNRTGVPVLNRWIQSARENITGDPDASAFHAAINTVANEYAKVVSSATGGGVTSDSARAEAMSLLNTAQTPQQLKSVIATMRQDMRNRIDAFNQTRSEHSDRMGSIGKPGQAKSKPAAQPAPTGNPNPTGYVQGHVYGGLTYLGGDPNSAASWRK